MICQESGGLAGSPCKANSCVLVLRGGPVAPRRSLLNLSTGAHSSRSCRHVVSLPKSNSDTRVGFWWQRHASHDNLETNPCHRKQCGLGPPTGASSSSTATHLVGVPSAARWGEAVAVKQGSRSRSPRGRPWKGFTSRELRHRLAKQGVEKMCKPSGRVRIPTRWEFSPARPTASGRKGYRRGSALRIKNFGSNPKETSVA